MNLRVLRRRREIRAPREAAETEITVVVPEVAEEATERLATEMARKERSVKIMTVQLPEFITTSQDIATSPRARRSRTRRARKISPRSDQSRRDLTSWSTSK